MTLSACTVHGCMHVETDTAKIGSNRQNATDGSHCSENTAVLLYRIYQLFKVFPFSTRCRCLLSVSLKPVDCHCFSRKNCFAESFVWFYCGTKPTDPTEDVICFGPFAVVNLPKLEYGICILEGCLTVHLPHEIKWNANLMQLGDFIDVFLARHVSGTYDHRQEH